MNERFTVRCQWDPEAEVWYVSESDVIGLSAEGRTLEVLFQRLLVIVPELVELNHPGSEEEVPIELLCSRSANVRVHR